jgi:hypothetical protein
MLWVLRCVRETLSGQMASVVFECVSKGCDDCSSEGGDLHG